MSILTTATGLGSARKREFHETINPRERHVVEGFSLKESWQTFKLVLRLSSNFKRGLWLVFGLNLAIAVMMIVEAYPLKYATDKYMAGAELGAYIPSALLLVVLLRYLPNIVLPGLRDWCSTRYLMPPLEQHLTISGFGALAHSDIRRGENLGCTYQPTLINGLNEICNLVETLTRDTTFLIRGVLVCLVFLYGASFVPMIGMVIFLGVAGHGVFTFMQARSTKRLFDIQQKAKVERDSVVIDSVDGILKTRALDVHERNIEGNLAKVADQYRTARYSCEMRWIFWSYLMRDNSMQVGHVLIFGLAFWYLHLGVISLGTIAMLIDLARKADDPLTVVAMMSKRLLAAAPLIEAFRKNCC